MIIVKNFANDFAINLSYINFVVEKNLLYFYFRL